jgi:hypothetical protein
MWVAFQLANTGTNVNTLEWWANNANSSVFDFACYYKMNDAFDGNNLNLLNDDDVEKKSIQSRYFRNQS